MWWLWASELWCGVVWCMFVVLDQCSLLCCVLLCCVQAGLTKELLFNKSTTQARMATSLQIIYSLAGCIRNSEYLAVPFNSIHTIIENLAHSLMNPTLRCVATYCMSRHVWSTGPSSTKPQYPPELQNRHCLHALYLLVLRLSAREYHVILWASSVYMFYIQYFVQPAITNLGAPYVRTSSSEIAQHYCSGWLAGCISCFLLSLCMCPVSSVAPDI